MSTLRHVVYVSMLVFLGGCSTTPYQEDARHGSAVTEAIERQARQARLEEVDSDLLHCMMMRRRALPRGQDGETARAPLQRHEKGLLKIIPPQETKPLVKP